MILGWFYAKCDLCEDWKSKSLHCTTLLKIGHMTKLIKAFFLETTNVIEPKLYMNDCYMFPYKVVIFNVDRNRQLKYLWNCPWLVFQKIYNFLCRL